MRQVVLPHQAVRGAWMRHWMRHCMRHWMLFVFSSAIVVLTHDRFGWDSRLAKYVHRYILIHFRIAGFMYSFARTTTLQMPFACSMLSVFSVICCAVLTGSAVL